jgi:hypothetical protein
MTIEEMQRGLVELDKESRSEILYFLINLIEDDEVDFDTVSEEEYDRLWAEECKRRCDEIDKGTAKLIPADEVFARARARLAERYLERAKELTA